MHTRTHTHTHTRRYAYRRDLLKEPSWLLLLGVFYRECVQADSPRPFPRIHPDTHARTRACRYEPTSYYWDFLFLMRRLFLCLCAVVFRGNPGRPRIPVSTQSPQSTPCEHSEYRM
jgi:hypothetical protein